MSYIDIKKYVECRYILVTCMNDTSPNKNPVDLVVRILGDVDSSITTIIILNLISRREKIWGYQLKQDLFEIIETKIQNSTLYTILRNLELKYSILDSEMANRRRYYWLTEGGKEAIDILNNGWSDLITKSEKLFKKTNNLSLTTRGN